MCEAAQIPQPDGRKQDWNDLHQRWQFLENEQERKERLSKDLAEARHHGALLIAESAEEKGLLMYTWRESHLLPRRQENEVTPNSPPGSRRLSFGIYDPRQRARSMILNHASRLLGHSKETLTQHVYRRVGEVVNPTK